LTFEIIEFLNHLPNNIVVKGKIGGTLQTRNSINSINYLEI